MTGIEVECLPLQQLTTKIGSGATPRGGGSSYHSQGVPLIRSMNVYDLSFHDEGLAFIDDEQARQLNNVQVHEGDVLLNITGASVARCCMAPPSLRGARVNQHVAILRPHADRLDGQFLAYVLVSPTYKSQLLNLAGAGATREALTKGGLEQFAVPAPSLEIQRRIASILGMYDDLIEVNRRRVAMLEEMARGLFEEWFIRFRFPGHESVPIANTPDGPLPQGWTITTLGALCGGKSGIQTGPFGSQLHQGDYTVEGVPVVMPKNIADLRIETDGIARIPEAIAQNLCRHLMVVGDTVYGRRGDIGRRAYISETEEGFFCGTGCLRIRPDQRLVSPRYLFMALGTPETEGAIKARATGATMPNLSAGVMKDVPVLAPSVIIQQAFDVMVTPAQRLAGTLRLANRALSASRDLLLPRLISGQLSVAAAARELEEAA